MRNKQQVLFKPESDWVPRTDWLDFRDAKRIALDVETCDPDLFELGPGTRRGGYMVGIAIGIEDGPRFYLPFAHDEGGNLPEEQVKSYMVDQFKDFKGEVTGAKLMYDLDYMDHWGVAFPKVKNFLDVQIAEPLIDENRFRFSLESLAKDYEGEGKVETMLDEACKKTFGIKNSKAGLHELHSKYVGAYAEGDVDLPLRILRKQEKIINQQGLGTVWQLECDLIPLLLAMRRRGCPVSLKRAQEVDDIVRPKYQAAYDKICDIAGKRVSIDAPDDLEPVFKKLGFTLPRTPKTDKASITQPWLKKHEGHDFIDTLLTARKYDTVIKTFLDGGVYKHNIRGRIHTEFNQLRGEKFGGSEEDRTGTPARFSSSNPNLQNIPARDPELGPLIRSIYVPEEGEDWLASDYSQIEYRFLANYALGPGSDKIRQQYNDDPTTDFHKVCALFAKMDATDKHVRKQVKNVNFGTVYGSGEETTAATMGVSIEEARAFLKVYHRELPFVRKTFYTAKERAENRGYIITALGRRRRFPLWESAVEWGQPAMRLEAAEAKYGKGRIKRAYTYRALNALMQDSAATQMKKAMVDAHKAGVYDVIGVPLLTVHDELGMSIGRTKKHYNAVRELVNCMEQAIELKVPVLVESEMGDNWGHTKKVQVNLLGK